MGRLSSKEQLQNSERFCLYPSTHKIKVKTLLFRIVIVINRDLLPPTLQFCMLDTGYKLIC